MLKRALVLAVMLLCVVESMPREVRAGASQPAATSGVAVYVYPQQQVNCAAAGPSAAATLNASCINAALAAAGHSGQCIYISGFWHINASIALTYNQCLTGPLGGRGWSGLVQDTANTPVVTMAGPKITIFDLKLTYNTQQPNTATQAYVVQWGLSGGGDFWYLGGLTRVTAENAYTCFGPASGTTSPGGGNSEFQNNYTDTECNNPSGYGWITVGGSGSVWNNRRIQGTGGGGVPGSADIIQAVYMNNVDNFVVNGDNIEHMCPADNGGVMSLIQVDGVENGLHFEGICQGTTDFAVDLIGFATQANVVFNNLAVVFNTSFTHSQRLFHAVGGANATIVAHGIKEDGNTYTSGKYLALAAADDTSSQIWLTGLSIRNSQNAIIPSRNSLRQVDQGTFDSSGVLMSGFVTSACLSAITSFNSFPLTTSPNGLISWGVGDVFLASNPANGATRRVVTVAGTSPTCVTQ